jgi:GntR family transcriptional regulator, transcriptional repressor for pyruvate dehydrogenase complex
VPPRSDLSAAASPVPSRALDLEAPALVGIRRLTALDTVRARIALAVDLGLLGPGERLPASEEIARTLGVGEMTVRRALVSLCRDGVLERRPGRAGGTLVAERPARGVVQETAAYAASATAVHRLIDQRVLVECGVAHLAAREAGEEDLARLRGLVEEMDAAEAWTDFHALDQRFHEAVAAATGLPVEPYRALLQELYAYYLPYPISYLRESNDEHRRLVDALRRRDVAAAVEVARRHVSVLHDSMFMGLLDRPDDGPS